MTWYPRSKTKKNSGTVVAAFRAYQKAKTETRGSWNRNNSLLRSYSERTRIDLILRAYAIRKGLIKPQASPGL
jgi:hypothetical protein